MGGFETPKAYLDNQLTWERRDEENGTLDGCRVIKSVSTGSAYYAAVERYGNDDVVSYVTAVICLVRWNPNAASGEIFGYKDMDENSGPYEAGCPRSVLDCLGPTSHPHALDWRNRCYRNLRLKERKLADGDIIRLPEPMRFTDGSEHSEFRVVKQGSRIELTLPAGGGRFKISRLMERRFEVVKPAQAVRTFFPAA
jgi:hypothetical protein